MRKGFSSAALVPLLLLVASGTGLAQWNGDASILFDGVVAGPFLKDPYLLYTGTNSQMTVQWQMQDIEQCLIEWGTDTNYSMGSALTEEHTEDHLHIHTITGLTPSTKYYYRVSCSGTEIAGNFYAAPGTEATDVSLMVYGDTRSNYMTHDALVAVMIEEYTTHPEFQTIFVHGGDFVYTGGLESSWQFEFFNDEQTHVRQFMREVALVGCLGNHELYSDTAMHLDTPLFGKYLPYPYVNRRYWSLDYGPVHIVLVDLYPEYYEPFEPGVISAEELEWIESDLAVTSKPWKFVIIHEPGWSCGPHENNQDVQNLLQPLLEDYGVQFLFASHTHYYARACVNGVHHITTAGGGAPLYIPQPGRPNIITANGCYHFCRVEITGDLLCLSGVSNTGEVIDSICIDLNASVNYLLGSVTIGSGPGLVEDVLVEAGSESCNPDTHGYYGMMLEPGVYTVSANLSGYTPQTFEGIEIIEGTETTINISMNPLSVEGGGVPGVVSLAMSLNPFSTSTTIEFNLPTKGPVRLDVYDLSGRLVETLAEREITAGMHSVEFDGSGLVSGVYLVRLTSGSECATAKVVLVR